VETLIRDGKVTHGYMDRHQRRDPGERQVFHVENNEGSRDQPGRKRFPSREGGLKVGDVITELDGPESQRRQPASDRSRTEQPGASIKLEVLPMASPPASL